MTNKKIYELLMTTNLKVAYDHFVVPVEPPFILYREDIPETFKADNYVYYKTNTHIVDLVTEKKDVELEEKIEKLFNDNQIPYEKTSDYIDDENIYQIEYSI